MATVDDDVLSVLFLDVGQGDASLVLPPGARGAIVFDCRDARVVMKHLDDFGIARIEAVVFSPPYSPATASAAFGVVSPTIQRPRWPCDAGGA